jgi:hypothetical protein
MLTATVAATGAAATHFHVYESLPGCLPEAGPQVTTDASEALDALAHMLADWSETVELEDHDATYAAAVAEIYCTCPQHGRSAEHYDALVHLEEGEGLSETAGSQEFEITVCSERDCLKYCPDDECRTIAPVGVMDTRCWCCGAGYVPWAACPWLT